MAKISHNLIKYFLNSQSQLVSENITHRSEECAASLAGAPAAEEGHCAPREACPAESKGCVVEGRVASALSGRSEQQQPREQHARSVRQQQSTGDQEGRTAQLKYDTA